MIDLVECLRKFKKNSNHRCSSFKGRYRSRTNIYLLMHFPVCFIFYSQRELWWQGWFMTCYFSVILFLWYPLGIGRTIIYIYTLTFPVFHGVQGQPMLAADPHSFGTATMATRCRWPVKQNNHYPTLSSTPSPGVTFDELNSLYWKLS